MKRKIKRLLRMNLTKKIIWMMLSLLVINFMANMIMFRMVLTQNNREEMISYAQKATDQTADTLDKYLTNLDYTAYTVMASNWMQQLLFRQNDVNTIKYLTMWESARYFIGTVSQMNDDMGIAVYGNNGTFLTNSMELFSKDYDISKESWYDHFLDYRKYAAWGSDFPLFYLEQTEDYFVFYYEIRDLYHFQNLGTMMFLIPAERFPNLSETETTCFALKDAEGRMIMNSAAAQHEKLMTGQKRLVEEEGNYYVVSESPIGRNDWTIVTVTEHEIPPFWGSIQSIFLWISVGFFGILLICASIVVDRKLKNPILEIRNAFQKMQNQENWGMQLKNHYRDEVGELYDGFNDMSLEIQSLNHKNHESEKLRRKAEMEMLMQKINPHFLYNTLEMISGMIMEKKDEDAVEVCSQMGKMFRYNLHMSDTTTLGQEYDYINEYITIVKHKLCTLEFYTDMEESLRNMKFRKFLLQPLVENSIKHGFLTKRTECCMELSISLQDHRVFIELMDNGSGISEQMQEKLESMLQDVREDRKTAGDGSVHVGVENVYRRLWLEYGDEMTFQIISKDGYGTKIKISIPEGEYVC